MALTTETLNNKKLSNKSRVDLTAKYKRMSQQKKLKTSSFINYYFYIAILTTNLFLLLES